MGADYLAYSLMDAIVDNYFVLLETLGDRVEAIEEELVSNPSPQILMSIHKTKRQLVYLRKSMWPLREVIGTMNREESLLITEATSVYLKDLYDHTIQVIDTVETLRDVTSGLLDIYLSIVSNRMNEVMKVLTIIATIFIPLTFIAGIYGMNFLNMPELEWRLGYYYTLIVMLGVAIIMVYYFRTKQWL
jgi:magnesium transporter